MAAVRELDDPSVPLPTPRYLRDLVVDIGRHAPLLLLIDEFGKNLEAFGEYRGEADLFFLQTIAEWPQDRSAHPLVAMTLQHLAFEEYVDSASTAMRREWAKVQGRFEDIPYVDSPSQARRLMASVWSRKQSPKFDTRLRTWMDDQTEAARRAGVMTLFTGPSDIAQGWPLHPVTQLILPELCSRYGQNERTLFSFLASSEPLSVATWLTSETLPADGLPAVGPDRVYDYFVDSASVALGASQAASRWLEIETAIRDAIGLSPAARRVLKTVGLLNLVSAGGTLRASREVVLWAASHGGEPVATDEVNEILSELEAQGRLTWRDFAGEYRLWRGSDLDIAGELFAARREVRHRAKAGLLNAVAPLPPAIAARHSISTGTTRVFRQEWVDAGTPVVSPPLPNDGESGLLVRSIDGSVPTLGPGQEHPKPVVVICTPDSHGLVAAAEEAVVIGELLRGNAGVADDPVATRELLEREAEALHRLEAEMAELGNSEGVTWYELGPDGSRQLPTPPTLSAGLSMVCDETYRKTPQVRNELLNRHELSSQGARARRELLESLIRHSDREKFGISGFGPVRAMFDAVFGVSGMHAFRKNRWQLDAPPDAESNWAAAWSVVQGLLESARGRRINLLELLDALHSPPCGMTAGAAPVLVVAALLLNSEIALYEHGTYRPRLTVEICERLVRNPAHFEVKHFSAARGPRREAIFALAEHFQLAERGTSPTVLRVVAHLASVAQGLPPYVRQTRSLSGSALALRRALFDAREPDVLLFEELPRLVGREPIPARASNGSVDSRPYARELKRLIDEVSSCYDRLLSNILEAIRESTAGPREDLRVNLASRAAQLDGQVLDVRLRGLLSAFRSSDMDDRDWAEYVGMAVAGPPPSAWTDEDYARFRHAIVELGGTLRRLEAIQFDRRAADGKPFAAVRLTLTKSDGLEHARVVALDSEAQEALAAFADRVLTELENAFGGGARAQEAFLAVLAENLMSAASQSARTVTLHADNAPHGPDQTSRRHG